MAGAWASRWISSKEVACNAGDAGFDPGLGRPLGGGHDQATPVILPGDPMD